MPRVLLTVSGVIPSALDEQVQQGNRPRPDYLAMARAFDADLIDYAAARRQTGWIGSILERIVGANVLLAWACYRQRHLYESIFTDGEQVGIPFAFFLKLSQHRSVRHLMIAHILSVPKKMVLFDVLRLHTHIDVLFVYSTWQKRFIESRWHLDPQRVIWTPFMVDARFFAPSKVVPQRRRMICSVGLEFRDYPTLMKAVDGLDVEVVIAAASPWSKRSDTTQGQHIPPNVTVRRFSQYELRQLYADSLFVVMPLYEVNFQAGVTAILEAMAMERAVICSRTAGQTDIIIEGTTGCYVPTGDVAVLRNTIAQLLDQPDQADAMGIAGREYVERELNLDQYCERLLRFVEAEQTVATTVEQRA
jgi:glycosyltransferase involved in cell wall biosynthesis